MGYIDDATGRVFARFYPYEGTIPAMDSFKRYIKAYGIPVSAYLLDKHTTYKSNAKPTVEDEDIHNINNYPQKESGHFYFAKIRTFLSCYHTNNYQLV